MNQIKSILNKLGPGMLYAGAAIGVSHLVQSTRAGAEYGNSLWWIIIISNLVKYPFFQFGPRYVAATGNNLLHGYKKLGSWALWTYIIMTLVTMFAIQAAVTIVTAGLLENIFNFGISASWWSLILLLICGGILMFDKYSVLDKIVKYIIIILTITTLVCLCVASGKVQTASPPALNWNNELFLLFVVALMGWMPAPLDISIWHSIWAEAKDKENKSTTSLRDQMFDFNVGYIGTALLALCFMGLGSIIMFGSGKSFESSSVSFASQLINLYTDTLGSWSYPIIAIACTTTMISTTLTLLDAFPRSLRESFNLAMGQENKKQYSLWLALTIIGTSIVLFAFLKNMKAMVDLATTISFVLAPVVAIINTLVITSDEITREYKPNKYMISFAITGIIFLCVFSVFFIWMKF